MSGPQGCLRLEFAPSVKVHIGTEKKCTRCLKILPRESFYLNRFVKSGLTTRCKSCDREYHRTHDKRKKELSALKIKSVAALKLLGQKLILAK